MKSARKITAAARIVLAVLLAAGCGSSPKAAAVPDELDAAIREASDYLDSNVPGGNKIVILNVQSDSAALSDYIIDELIANAVNDKNFPVVDRQQLDAIRSELDFQWAGEVDDNSAQEIGKMVGAQTIVSGAISKVGENYRMRIRALEVQTAQVQGQFNRNIPAGATITALMNSSSGSGDRAGTQTAQDGTTAVGGGQAKAPAKPQTPAYKIGDTGPAGGLIFYDKGNSQGGWRYLEAAPAETEVIATWAAGAKDSLRTDTIRQGTVGMGKRNTQEIMTYANTKAGGGFGWAAQACDELEINGFDDWFLPSLDELSYMYGNLHRKGLGDFLNVQYWSSTATAVWEATVIDFANGEKDDMWSRYDSKRRVRAARQF